MLIIYSLFTILLIIIFYLLLKFITDKKIIGQKISFLYNEIYKILILDFYKKKENKRLKEEIVDYYKNIVYNNSIFVKSKNWNNTKRFISLYYEDDSGTDINTIINDIDFLLLRYYKSISYNINTLLFMLIIIITIFIVLILNY